MSAEYGEFGRVGSFADETEVDLEMSPKVYNDVEFDKELADMGLHQLSGTLAGSLSVARRSSRGNLHIGNNDATSTSLLGDSSTSAEEAAAERADDENLPLPLIHFTTELGHSAKTVFDTPNGMIKAIANDFDDSMHLDSADRSLHDPSKSMRLSKYFLSLSMKEQAYRESTTKAAREGIQIVDDEVYKCKLLSSTTEPEAPSSKSVLTFDGEFESGNIEKAVLVSGREKLREPTITSLNNTRNIDFDVPDEVAFEYDITIRNDINTTGNIQWFYFSASAPTYHGDHSMGTRDKVLYPLTVRFQIVNLEKKDSLYNYGMRPVSLSEKQRDKGWTNVGKDICYFKNGRSILKRNLNDKKAKKLQYLYSTVFTYTFKEPDTLYFAHCFPYTYSDLQRYLHSIEQDKKLKQIVHRKLLCTTLAGNRCDLLTISGRCASVEESNARPAIVISARVHPGETNSSYMMQGVIEFLISDAAEAIALRKHFVFKVIPMMNPDGVIHGNYRCSLAGADLNRKYGSQAQNYYPTVIAMKNLLKTEQNGRGITLYLDLHGHSKKKNAFVYGCDMTYQHEKVLKQKLPKYTAKEIENQRVFSRLFPYMLSRISDEIGGSNYFSYKDCCFGVARSKSGTGRVVAWDGLSIEAAYTIELSFCGPGNNSESKLLKKSKRVMDKYKQLEDTEKEKVAEEKASGASIAIGDTTTAATTSEALTTDADDSDNNSDAGNESDNAKVKLSKELGTKTAVPAVHQSSASLKKEALEILNLLDSYKSQSHYSKKDLKSIGQSAVLSIFYYANLDRLPAAEETLDTTRPDSASSEITSRSDRNSNKMGSISIDNNYRPSSTGNNGNDTGTGTGIGIAKNLGIISCEYDSISEAQLRPSVFSRDAAVQAIVEANTIGATSENKTDIPSFDKNPLNLRMKCEIAVRKQLNLIAEITFPGVPIEDFDEEKEDNGSDSNPSEDEISEKTFSKSMGKVKNIGNALKKATRKARQKILLSESESESESVKSDKTVKPSSAPDSGSTKKRVNRDIRARSKMQSGKRQVFPGAAGAGAASVPHSVKYKMDSRPVAYDMRQFMQQPAPQCATVDMGAVLQDVNKAMIPTMKARSMSQSKRINREPERRRSFESLPSSDNANGIAATEEPHRPIATTRSTLSFTALIEQNAPQEGERKRVSGQFRGVRIKLEDLNIET